MGLTHPGIDTSLKLQGQVPVFLDGKRAPGHICRKRCRPAFRGHLDIVSLQLRLRPRIGFWVKHSQKTM